MENEFEKLRPDILQCRKCHLWQSRHHVIFGEGHPHAGVFIIGEATGRDEALNGGPFIGKSGQLLDKILFAGGFSRQEHVFISNIVRCRPPDNRVPTTEEAAICLPWLMRQIELVDPKILVFLGATALKHMAGPEHRITRERGQWMFWQERWAMPVYHPAALLRDPGLKRDTWEDFKKIVAKYRELVNPGHLAPHC